MANVEPELHLSIIWEKARHHEATILERIASSFRIRAIFEVHWTPEKFSQNLSRFYGQSLPDHSEKARHCGTGPFLLVLFDVTSPIYALRNTLAGPKTVLTQVFDFKQHFRDLAQGGLPLHATNDPREVEHDLLLLTGRPTASFSEEAWDGTTQQLERDLTGSQGWPDLQTLFAVLNTGPAYVVLRNFDTLLSAPINSSYNDIDILCDDTSVAWLAHAQPRFPSLPGCAYYTATVAEQEVLLEFRTVEEGYYCKSFSRQILGQREYDPQGFYRPCAKHHYYAHLYHALLHKPAFGHDSLARLNQLATRLALDAHLSGARLQALAVLDDYMQDQEFAYAVPQDATIALEHGLLAAYLDTLRLPAFGNEHALARALTEHLESGPGQANVLRPFADRLCGDVLEVGARAGGLTTYLASHAQSLTAVEPSARLRPILRNRMTGAARFEIRTDLPIATEEVRYDAIILDGQLPFAARFIDHSPEQPATALLNHLRTLLKPDGALIVIEHNPLGMASLSERPAQSLAGNTDETAGRGSHEIKHLLNETGFIQQRWHYAFPDAQTASTILSSDALDDGDFDTAALINSTLANRSAAPSTPFPLHAAWDMAVRNQQVGLLANAFIVLASTEPLPAADMQPLAFHFATNRLPQHAKSVHFIRTPEGIVAQHRKLTPTSREATSSWLEAHEFDEPYLVGRPWQLDLEHALSRPGWRFSAIETWVRGWFDQLVTLELGNTPRPLCADTPVPGRLIDAMPRNLIVSLDGRARFIDLEWAPVEDIPLGYVMFRGILLALMSARDLAAPAPGVETDARHIFLYLSGQLGVDVSHEALTDYIRREQAFQFAASGWDWPELSQMSAFPLQIRAEGLHMPTNSPHATPPQSEPRTGIDPALDADRQAYLTASVMRQDGHDDEAGLMALIQQAEQGSSWWETYNDLGAHAYESGALEDAENLFQAAVELEPTPSDASCNLARLRIAQNRREEALSLLGAVARANPKRTDILIDIRSLLSSYDSIPPVVWARLLSDLRSTGNASEQP